MRISVIFKVENGGYLMSVYFNYGGWIPKEYKELCRGEILNIEKEFYIFEPKTSILFVNNPFKNYRLLGVHSESFLSKLGIDSNRDIYVELILDRAGTFHRINDGIYGQATIEDLFNGYEKKGEEK